MPPITTSITNNKVYLLGIGLTFPAGCADSQQTLTPQGFYSEAPRNPYPTRLCSPASRHAVMPSKHLYPL